MQNLKLNTPHISGLIYWARAVRGNSEELLTTKTKHTFYELEFALEGPIILTLNSGDQYTVNESDYILIPPGTFHQVIGPPQTAARFIIAFSIETLAPAYHLPNEFYIQHSTDDMLTLLSLICKKQEDSPVLGSLLECLILEFLDTAAFTNTGPGTHRVAEILHFIQNCNGIDMSVSELASRYNLSERHLHRLFQDATGKGPKEAINYEKLKKIERYAVSTELSLGEIAELCGFCDEYAMNKFFKRYNLINLSEFRQLAKKH